MPSGEELESWLKAFKTNCNEATIFQQLVGCSWKNNLVFIASQERCF
jgi:hypothetical protein